MKRTTTRTLALIASAMIPITLVGLADAGTTARAGTIVHAEEPEIDPEAKEIWDRYIELTLGEAAEDRSIIQSIVQEGKMEMTAQGVSMRMKMVILPSRGMRLTMTIPQMGSFEQGMWDGTAWSNNTMQGPRILEGAEADQFAQQSDIFSDLEWHKYYNSIRYKGEETITMDDGSKVDTHVLIFDAKHTEAENTQYFSKETGLLVKSVTMVVLPGQGEAPSSNYLSDYREREGLMIPFRNVSKLGPQESVITFSKVEINTDVDESTIEPPQEIKEMIDG